MSATRATLVTRRTTTGTVQDVDDDRDTSGMPDAGFVELVAVFAAALADRPFGSPCLLASITGSELRPPPGASRSECWTIDRPVELPADLFDSVAGLRLDPGASGVVAAVDSTVCPTGGDTPLALELAVHADASGHCRTRTVTAVRRDGMGVRMIAVQGGTVHRLGAPSPGRVRSALARTIGAPSAFTSVPSMLEVAVRAWLVAQLSVVDSFAAAFATDTGIATTDAGDTMVVATPRIPGFGDAFPAPVRHLAEAADWQEILDRLDGDLDGIRWLFERAWTDRASAPLVGDDLAAALHVWCDVGMVAHLYDCAIPDFDRLEERHGTLVDRGLLAMPFAELTELATTQVTAPG
jgi:hypothetical protein